MVGRSAWAGRCVLDGSGARRGLEDSPLSRGPRLKVSVISGRPISIGGGDNGSTSLNRANLPAPR